MKSIYLDALHAGHRQCSIACLPPFILQALPSCNHHGAQVPMPCPALRTAHKRMSVAQAGVLRILNSMHLLLLRACGHKLFDQGKVRHMYGAVDVMKGLNDSTMPCHTDSPYIQTAPESFGSPGLLGTTRPRALR